MSEKKKENPRLEKDYFCLNISFIFFLGISWSFFYFMEKKRCVICMVCLRRCWGWCEDVALCPEAVCAEQTGL
ncbi:unnamed protein product [Notodromas monacha]|uniref:Uncharacterized protein n=1 Tax=Notodromas monacha TaxID=399045 RepID=A0A7R9BMW0_9CRUS|nr:unnamed protein product [Notodromas monacha]CAG0917069.1 unnamed protein product [Notodromas monacha]